MMMNATSDVDSYLKVTVLSSPKVTATSLNAVVHRKIALWCQQLQNDGCGDFTMERWLERGSA